MESIEIMTGIGVLLDTILFPIFKTVHPVGLIDTLSFVEIRFLISKQLRIGERFWLNQESNKLLDTRGAA